MVIEVPDMLHLLLDHMSNAGTSGWDAFYDGRLKLGVQFLVPFAISLAVLTAVSGLITRWTILRDAETWGANARWAWGIPGVLAILAAAVFLPLYPLFHPFNDGTWLSWLYGFALLTPALALLSFATRPRLGPTSSKYRQLPIPTLVVLLCLWTALASCFYFWGQGERLLVTEVSLVLFGVTATATALGQALRLQVESHGADGKLNAAASDYVLARIQQSDSHKADGLGISRSTDLTALLTADFSAVPVGAIASAAARVLYAIRPGLTWRARITVVDPDRVVVALTRNSHNVENIIISRRNLLLPALPANLKSPQLEAEQGRAHAQLLTGAAACILVCLSRVHTDLSDSLCGAEQWRSVAMQMIANERALCDDASLELRLLREAVDLEPHYGTARLAYAYALLEQFRGPSNDRLRFADWMDQLAALAKEAPETHERTIKKGWEVIRMRAMYSSVAIRLNYCLQELADDWKPSPVLSPTGTQALTKASRNTERFAEDCEQLLHEQVNGYVTWYAERMTPTAANLKAAIAFLEANLASTTPVPWNWEGKREEYPRPGLAYDYGCSAGLVHAFGGAGRASTDLFDAFSLALATDTERKRIRTDPDYLLLRAAGIPENLHAVLGPEPPETSLLDLSPFATYSSQLTRLGVTTLGALRQHTETGNDRLALAGYLHVDPIVVDYYTALCNLVGIHSDLDTPGALKVLLDADINSRHDLLQQLELNESALLTQLQTLAAKDDVSGLPAFTHPTRWLSAAKALM
ncbi:hypothetical protein ACEZCY_22340 [Streptacidiphilus sp. N1-12]|uniref:Uncharacterized protein n=2 Tax=Streptacidiphilus alkalitolerans TaxID=3342712 RepID=A0ABV6WIR4_9ACTN